ncbi:MAG: 4-aminobutyrate--2-oxoglutarate transaminase [Elusimicrobia bacterium]|nr:4-aminobutyrate--2-oxoglutarate transaminase [Elusimicrobiota bacterium]
MTIKTSEKNFSATESLKELERFTTRAIYRYSPLELEKGQGARVWDRSGREYIDFAGGIGALNVGHCHPKVLQAARAQMEKLIHTCFHVASYEPYLRLCQKLCEAMPGKFPKKAVFFNSGAEAVENAVKLARYFTRRPGVLAFDYSFHGRTLLALTLTGKEKPYKHGFGPLATEVYHAVYPYPYRPPEGVNPSQVTQNAMDSLERIFETQIEPQKVAAILVEPILGEGGFVVPPEDFLPRLRKLCDQHGILLILDEIQSGFGRTGWMFACERTATIPDLMTVAKSLAAGFPLSGIVGRAEVLDAPEPGGLGSTYGGNPVACAAALAVFEIFKEENLLERSQKLGKIIGEAFQRLAQKFPFVGEARGLGAMQALELVQDRESKKPYPEEKMKRILFLCEGKGLLLLKAGLHNNVLRTLVPLVAKESEVAQGLEIIESALQEIQKI